MNSMILCYLVISSQVLVSETGLLSAGPVGEYDIIQFESCDIKTDLNSSIELEIKKTGNVKSISGKLVLGVNFDKFFKADIRIDTWSGSEWKTDAYKQNGYFCDFSDKVAPKIYKRLLSKMKPSIDSTCAVPKGFYAFENIQAVPSEINIKSLIYGRCRGTIIISDKNGKKLLCIKGETVIKQ